MDIESHTPDIIVALYHQTQQPAVKLQMALHHYVTEKDKSEFWKEKNNL